MRLADTIARRRACYPRPLPTLPDLCVIDVPRRFAAPLLPLGRFYPVIVETNAEWREWDAFLDADRVAPVAPDLFDRRPSALSTAGITFAHYDPPAPSWPWVLLCHWPACHVEIADDHDDLFARSAYSMEVTPDPDARATLQDKLFHALGSRAAVDIVIVPPSAVIGNG